MPVPAQPKIYHIVHADRLSSIVEDGCLLCDAEVLRCSSPGTSIGISKIKERRLNELTLSCHPDLYVGQCVPFYFCPRSIMLYLIHRANDPELTYRGGQNSIIHLEADLYETVDWADENDVRWAFTSSNAGSRYAEFFCDVEELDEINWEAVQATQWRSHKDGKQAEFLMENSFPWELIERIGIISRNVYPQVVNTTSQSSHHPTIQLMRDWYY